VKKVFADTVYWIALYDPKDMLHQTAITLTKKLVNNTIVSTDAVLTEVLTSFSSYGSETRKSISFNIKELLQQKYVIIYPSDRNLFLEGLNLFQSRLDKEYSQVDCISMVVMQKEKITEVLTSDHHFEQEGFSILLA